MKNKIEINIALLALALYLILERFTETHDLILGLIFGISIGFFLIGFTPEKFIKRIKSLKKQLILRK